MAISHGRTLNWPFWHVLNTVEFNWFAAPQHWQLALPRFLMGFGSGMVLLSMTGNSSRDPRREAKIRPFLQVAQFSGGALAIGVLATYLLVGPDLTIEAWRGPLAETPDNGIKDVIRGVAKIRKQIANPT